jgi:hypothetical protein
MKQCGAGAVQLRLLVPVALWAATARPALASVVAFIPGAAPARCGALSSFGRRSLPVAFLARTAAAQGANLLKAHGSCSGPRLRGGGATAAHMSAAASGVDSLDQLSQNADHSWLQQLNMDPETEQYAPNKESRQVRSGHYVKVLPTPLPKPKYIIHSEAMAKALGISEADVQSERFVRFFSGDQAQIPGLNSWATPYALSM